MTFRRLAWLIYFCVVTWSSASEVQTIATVSPGGGAVGFTFMLPTIRREMGEPLLSVGQGGKGEIVFCRRLDDGKTVFGWYATGDVAFFSEPTSLPEGIPLQIMISLGSLFTTAPDGENSPLAKLAHMVLIQVQGRTLLSVDHAAPPTHLTPEIGSNPLGGPFASAHFSGEISQVHSVSNILASAAAFSPVSLIAEDLPQRDSLAFPGPLELNLIFPTNRLGRNEPLIATGKTGKGDLVYVRYVDGNHVQFGFDHWSKGGPATEILLCDFSQTHSVIVSMGSLVAADAADRRETPSENALRARCVVIFDGRRVMDWGSSFFPTSAEQIFIGVNSIGASTAEAYFTGALTRLNRKPAEQISPVN